ncbi:MAG: potassium transporter Kup [Myxococcota bacterium]
MAEARHNNAAKPDQGRLPLLVLGAIGVVYGDIGTSPLYALRECFSPKYGIPLSPENILGILSLILWSLILVVSLRYLVFFMAADNKGEGGILALLTLVSPGERRRNWFLFSVGMFGAALFYGDGMITPAISVLSAVEGLQIATPAFEPYVVPLAIGILAALFLAQTRGTGAVGAIFGPVMVFWFALLAVLGAAAIVRAPGVLAAVEPVYALRFFGANQHAGFLTLGAVFLVVTGGEALYADMGHFGKRPIRIAWFGLVLPALLVNYFGQGALLLQDAAAAQSPFYHLAPAWGLYPLVGIATIATIIASQAVISGAFSITRQAIQLGYSPRLRVRHFSEEEQGQVYLPAVNWALLVGTTALVAAFGSSGRLANAYGAAVVTTMLIETTLAFVYIRRMKRWAFAGALVLLAALFMVDLSFFSANMVKFMHGAWLPLIVGLFLYTLMTTWNRGRAILRERLQTNRLPLENFIADVRQNPPLTAPGTAMFLDAAGTGVPRTLLHNLKHNKVVHERVIILTIFTEEVPRVPGSERLTIEKCSPRFIRVIAHYGFMQTPNVPIILRQMTIRGLECKEMETTFFLGRETLVIAPAPGMARWRKRLFRIMSRNALKALTHFHIPPNRVIEIGQQVEI